MTAKSPTAAEIRAIVEEPPLLDGLALIHNSPTLAPLWRRLAEEGKALRENNERCRKIREERAARKAAKEARRLEKVSGNTAPETGR